MKISLLLALWVVLCLSTGCTASLKMAPVRPGVGIGDVHLGMSMAQVKNVAGEPRVHKVLQDGVSYDYPSAGINVFARTGEMRVERVDAGSGFGEGELLREFWGKTKEGIGVGSTRAQVLKAYGSPDTLDAKGGKVVTENLLAYRTRGISFSLREERVVRISIFPPRN